MGNLQQTWVRGSLARAEQREQQIAVPLAYLTDGDMVVLISNVLTPSGIDEP